MIRHWHEEGTVDGRGSSDCEFCPECGRRTGADGTCAWCTSCPDDDEDDEAFGWGDDPEEEETDADTE